MSGSTIPVSGKLLKQVINSFCLRPYKGDDRWPQNSVGVARDSVVATDSRSAIVIGAAVDDHVATSRKEALLEAERALLYGEPVDVDGIERNCDDETGVAQPMPPIRKLIGDQLRSMKPIATMSPDALLAVAKVAQAAGAGSVDLFQPEGDAKSLGFAFTFEPDPEHINLFSSWEGDITARGVFVVSSAVKALGEDAIDDADAAEPVAAEPKKAKAKAKPEPVAVEPAEVPEADPVAVVDVAAVIERGLYKLPALNALTEYAGVADAGGYGPKIIETLRAFNVPGRVIAQHQGPAVTLYEIDVPQGVGVARVAKLADDLQMQLGVKSVRIQAPIPGKKAIGIEIPNARARTVGLAEVCAVPAFVDAEAALTVALGLDVSGRPVYADLASCPHLLIAGATNSGKSIGVASMLTSLLMRNTPKELRLVLIDPKQVELSLFDEIPHLACPVVTDAHEVPGVLRALVREMEHRYELLKEKGVRNIAGWNSKAHDDDKLPYFVVVIDELADLMMQAREECESQIVRLAQKARAVGIHLVVATQRPSVDVVTGLIKANIPSRIAFAVASQTDSRVILDANGAEKLLGRGDMLFAPVEGGGKSTRVQGAYVSEDEVAAVCAWWRHQQQPRYEILPATEEEDGGPDDLYGAAYDFVVERGQCSTSMLQRKFSIGFQRASKIQDELHKRGVVGPQDGPRPREVLVAGGSK